MPSGINKHKAQKGRRWIIPPMLNKHHSQKTKEKMSLSHKGFRHTEKSKLKMSLANKGKNFSGIKNGKETRFKAEGSKGIQLLGRNGYRLIHKWIVKQLGQPCSCNNCGLDNLKGRQIHWANRSGEYKKDVNDWVRLCVRCHFYKDKINIIV